MANIRLRRLNQDFILEKLKEIIAICQEVEKLNNLISSEAKIKKVIIKELKENIKNYGLQRKTEVMEAPAGAQFKACKAVAVENYPVRVVFTTEGYIKKIPSKCFGEDAPQKLKDGDSVRSISEVYNQGELIAITTKLNAYKMRLFEIENHTTSELGLYAKGLLKLENGEEIHHIFVTKDYSEYVIAAFDSGKVAKIPVKSNKTKTNRKKLSNSLTDREVLVSMTTVTFGADIVLTTTGMARLLVYVDQISAKDARNSLGVQVVGLKKGAKLIGMCLAGEGETAYRAKSIPMAPK